MTPKLAWPAFVACLAVLPFYFRTQDADSSSEDAVSLVQTYLQVGRPSNQTKAGQGLSIRVEGPGDLNHNFDAKIVSVVEGAGLGPANFLRELEPCSTDFEPMHMQAQTEMLRMLGAMPPREPCRPASLLEGEMTMSTNSNSSSSASSSSSSSVSSGFPMLLDINVPRGRTAAAILVPTCYLLIFGFIIGRMIYTILLTRPPPRNLAEKRSLRRPESEAWKSGLVSWLSISWATEWVTRWGNSTNANSTSIKADELDALGDPNDEPDIGYRRLLIIWQEEIRKYGLKNSSVLRVMIKFVTIARLCVLVAWTVAYEVAMYLGPPLAMQWTISYICLLYSLRIQGWEIPHAALAIPSLMVILTFTGLPLMMGVCNTVSSFLSQRMAIQVCGALSSLVVRKAQCLPVLTGATQTEKEKAAAQEEAAGTIKEGDSDDEIIKELDRKTKALRKKQAEEQGVPYEEENSGIHAAKDIKVDPNERKVMGYVQPETYSLVQVVANDINMNFVSLPLQIVRTVIILPVVIVLFFMLYKKVKCTIFLVLGTAFFMTFLTMRTAGLQIGHLMSFLNLVGIRLQYLESTIFSIRTVKACGWEGIINQKVLEMRQAELVSLENYYWRLGLMYTIVYAVPKAMVFVSVWGFILLYPHEDSVNIFAIMPLLFTTQSAVMSVLQTLPSLINAKPAVMRCEGFLKQTDAPCGRPRSEFKPHWLNLWDSADGPKAAPTAPAGAASSSSSATPAPTKKQADGPEFAGVVRVKGSFRWSEYGDQNLTDINIDLKTGKSLAVIGATGSGKTTLLHALLGELYPVDDACLEVPNTMSYAAQVPYICEGTLRENVLFGEPVDEEHYKTAIHAACLLPDLEMLPGGEEVPIGSRGISLSGGQKARVSMARASYHSQRGGLVLLDDPFGAVDSRTARHLLDHLIHGRGLEGRTRIVVTQPDPERIARFDEVMVISKGKIVARGTPGEVMETDLYQALLNSHQIEALKTMGEGDAMAPIDGTGRGDEVTKGKKAPEVFQLREEEFQGRIDWKTMNYFCSTGKWTMIAGCVGLYFCQQVCYLMMNVSLQHWSTDQMLFSAGVGHSAPRPVQYMWGYLAWFAASNIVWFVCWACGVWFTLRMSSLVFKSVLAGLMHAPTDRFFDRTPVGRIMNRLSSDLANLDNNTYNQITILIGLCWQTMVPISYIHILMPLYFTVLTIPVYYLIFSLIRRYWNTMVPMRYLTHVSKSSTDDILTEVQHSNISVRAMQKADFRLGVFQSLLSNQMKADITTTLVLQRWLVNRLFLLLGFFITILVLVAVWVPHVISFGGIGLALANCFQVVTGIEQYISSAAAAQFQFISLNRLYEYTKLPQERPNVLASDGKYKSFALMIPPDVLGKLVPKHEEGVVKLYRQSKSGHEELVLVQDPTSQTFAAPPHKNLSVLGKKLDHLEDTTAWHRITSAHGARGDIMKMTDKLCNPTPEGVYIEVQTGWLTDGAELVIEDLRAGYGDIPRDVLKEVNLIVDPRSKAGIVGTTGCGKSTLLLTLLRILEPREGRIMINGVNTASLGLQTLRQAVGLVPQDPVLLQTSVRENLDPFWTHSDEDIWKGLAMVQLAETVKQMEFGIWSPIAADGGNLSFGQRQLLCLARTVIRQPSLILLDEATSALDPATQELVQKTIESSFPLSTIIVIAHRLETILNFDLIIVMEQGSIAEKGSPTDLAQVKGGIFAKMLAAKRTW